MFKRAVSKGGVVLLKAVDAKGIPTPFNFSTDLQSAYESGYVNLTADVTIVGETVGRSRSTILGGCGPITGFIPVKSSIQGIYFESPFDDAIDIATSQPNGCDVAHRTHFSFSRYAPLQQFSDTNYVSASTGERAQYHEHSVIVGSA